VRLTWNAEKQRAAVKVAGTADVAEKSVRYNAEWRQDSACTRACPPPAAPAAALQLLGAAARACVAQPGFGACSRCSA